MNRTAVARINAAITSCLDKCYGAEMPLACLALFLDGLRSDRQWNAHDIEKVELGVLRILQKIAEADAEPAKCTSTGPVGTQHHQFSLNVPDNQTAQRRQRRSSGRPSGEPAG